MTKELLIKNGLFGFLFWLIPFATLFLFYKTNGELLNPYSTFKSLITVIWVISGCFLLVKYFLIVNSNFIKNGIIVGILWFVINVVLDSIILIPMMKTSFLNYFISIGFSYISIPAISITRAFLLKNKAR